MVHGRIVTCIYEEVVLVVHLAMLSAHIVGGLIEVQHRNTSALCIQSMVHLVGSVEVARKYMATVDRRLSMVKIRRSWLNVNWSETALMRF